MADDHIEDQFEEVTEESWFSRIMGAIKGFVIGIVLFVGSIGALWWNEARLVKQQDALGEILEKADYADPGQADVSMNGLPVSATAILWPTKNIGDGNYLRPGHYLKLKRKVEMFQWVENKKTKSKKKLGGGKKKKTTYTYTKQWSDKAQNSSGFKKPNGHQNPNFPEQTYTRSNHSTKFGTFSAQPVLERINDWQPLQLNKKMLGNMQDTRLSAMSHFLDGNYIYFKPAGRRPASMPEVGDLRVSYQYVKPGYYTALAKQQSPDRLVPYIAKNGTKKFLVQAGDVSIEEMITVEGDKQETITWILRGLGFLFCLIGLVMIFRPLSVFLDVVPLIGSMAGAGTFVLSLLLAMLFSSVTIVTAWVANRPTALFAVVGAVFLGLAGFIFMRRRSAGSEPAAGVGGGVVASLPAENTGVGVRSLNADDSHPEFQLPEDIADDDEKKNQAA